MNTIKLSFITLLVLGSIMCSAFAEPSSCDYYANKIVNLQNAKEFTNTDRRNVAALFRSIEKACRAKGATAVAKTYQEAAARCDWKQNCEQDYKNFIFQKGKFKGTISTKNWCGYLYDRDITVIKPTPEQVYSDLVSAIDKCNKEADNAYFSLLSNAKDDLCMKMIDGNNQIDPNPNKKCTSITNKLYQKNPNW